MEIEDLKDPRDRAPAAMEECAAEIEGFWRPTEEDRGVRVAHHITTSHYAGDTLIRLRQDWRGLSQTQRQEDAPHTFDFVNARRLGYDLFHTFQRHIADGQPRVSDPQKQLMRVLKYLRSREDEI